MKKLFTLLVALFLLGIASLKAQSTGGTEFWLTFGANYPLSAINPEGYTNANYEFQIRIVAGEFETKARIHFNGLGTNSGWVTIAPQEVYTYQLTPDERLASYNTQTATNNRSIRIESDRPITVYALNQAKATTDATNVFPVTALSTDYYHISYTAISNALDAYAVVATENGTQVYHNNGTTPVATLNAGEVYYRTSTTDMTGTHVTANKKVAFFALNQGTCIPNTLYGYVDVLMQQLAPVNTWGTRFFVPVSGLATDRVRIVASENGTVITQTGGTVMSGSLNLQAGQWVELEVYQSNNGCYITTNDKPVGVCTYLTGRMYPTNKGVSDPAQAWLPSLDQTIDEALISPFIPHNNETNLSAHFGIVITPTATRTNTLVSIKGGTPMPLNITGWRNNLASGMSYYIMPFDPDPTSSYSFTNDAGIIVMGYGTGPDESYYYLGFSAMRNLKMSFETNGIDDKDLPNQTICASEITFTADIKGEPPDNIKWYVNNVPYDPAENLKTWTVPFPSTPPFPAPGTYEIKLWVHFPAGDDYFITSTLNIGAVITTTESPSEGGTTSGAGCYKVGEMVNLVATPDSCHTFVNWTAPGMPTSTNPNYPPFAASVYRDFTANFQIKTNLVNIIISPSGSGTVEGGGGPYACGAPVTLTATPDSCYTFGGWMEGSSSEISENPYHFDMWATPRTLTAYFQIKTNPVTVSANPTGGGTVGGGGTYNCEQEVTVTATPDYCYTFVNWTEGLKVVSTNATYNFLMWAQPRDLVANFQIKNNPVTVSAIPTGGGTVGGDDDYDCGISVTVTAVADSCYTFVDWTENGIWVSDDEDYTFDMWAQPRDLVANFDLDQYYVTLSANPTGGGEVFGEDYYYCG
ncbi:MAG: hypothetical protein FWF09_05690, partial [Bacteroidales bacterium]|nr:hypothetical protein [Bacteroidales bacterium]